MRREIDELRVAMELRSYRTIEEWKCCQFAIREPLAARAFIAEWVTKGAL